MLRKWTPRDKCFKRGALGPIGNRKTVEKIIQNRKTGKKLDKNRKPPAKLSKPIYFHIPIIKTLIDPIQWWQVEYKYTNFITVFVNAMDLAFVSSSTCLNYRLYFSCSLDSHYCFLSHCPLSYCCTVFVIHDAWTPTDGQSLRRHSRRVNPLRINSWVAVPSPPPPIKRNGGEVLSLLIHLGRGRVRQHVGYLGIPAIFQLVCHAYLSITVTFSGCSRSVEVLNCRSNRRETGTQIGQIRKTENRIGYQIRKPLVFFRENRKPNAKKTENPQTAMDTKTEKPI